MLFPHGTAVKFGNQEQYNTALKQYCYSVNVRYVCYSLMYVLVLLGIREQAYVKRILQCTD